MLALVSLAAPLEAQRTEGRLAATAGAATDTRGVRSTAWSVSPALTLTGHQARGSFQARFTRFEGEGWAAGGGAGATVAVSLAPALALRLEAVGDYTRNSYRDAFLTLAALPSLEFRHGRVTASAGARGHFSRLSFDQTLPGGPLAPPSGARASLSRHGLGPTLGLDLLVLDLGRGGSVQVGAREEWLEVSGDRYRDGSLRALVRVGPLASVATVGVRRGPDEDRTWGGGRVILALGPVVSVFGTLESYPSNPVTGTLAGRTSAVGLSLSLGSPSRGPLFPRPASAPSPAPGLTRLSIRAPRALQVEVAGDWNDWRPVPLVRAPNGVWFGDLELPAGTYRFAFRIDGSIWQVPRGIAAVDDGFGGQAAWLTVPPPPPAQPTHTQEES